MDELRSMPLQEEGSNFYSALGLDQSATQGEINKASRRRAIEFHPDKNSDPQAKKFYKLLTSVSAILKDPKRRELYDGHLARGIPVWRGSGYYYKKYKPGLGTVLVFSILVISVMQYVTALVVYFLARNDAGVEAKYLELTPLELRKVLKKNGIDSPKTSRKSLTAASTVELLKEAGKLPPAQAPPEFPSLSGTLLFALPKFILSLPVRMFGSKEKVKGE
ncbi:MAG: hypothetical protein SGCHY_001814 [Lobulomycetales sp.]